MPAINGLNMRNSVNGYPGTVVYYQQRLYFAASTAFPQTIWASRTGDYKDFGKSNPTQDDDRIIYTYAGRQVNEIRHLIDVGSLVALTSGGEYVITGDQNKVLTPSSFAFSSQGSNGSSNVPPIAVANIALFVQRKAVLSVIWPTHSMLTAIRERPDHPCQSSFSEAQHC